MNRPSCYGLTAKQSPHYRDHKCINCLYLLDCVEKETMMDKQTRPDCYGTQPKPNTVLWDERNCGICPDVKHCHAETYGTVGSTVGSAKLPDPDDDASFWQCVDCKKNYTSGRAALDCCGASPSRRVPTYTKPDTLPCMGCGEPLTLHTVARHICSLELAKDCHKELGTKLDATKPRWSLLPSGTIAQVIAVLEYGAKKYAVRNWVDVPNANERYYDAAMRHLDAWRNGEDNDEESGLPHLAHACCCLLFLMWFDGKSVS